MWERTFMLKDNNSNTFVANDGFGHGYSIVLKVEKEFYNFIYKYDN